MHRTCVKCGHTNTVATGTADEACPQCGAIYAKAVAGRPAAPPAPAPAAAAGRPSGFSQLAARASAFGDAVSTFAQGSSGDHVAYAAVMRSTSLYPALRTVVRFGYLFGMFIAGMVALVGLITAFTLPLGGFISALASLGLAAFIALAVHAWRELSLMLADLADAAVRLAASSEKG